jgi:hypothetical protein
MSSKLYATSHPYVIFYIFQQTEFAGTWQTILVWKIEGTAAVRPTSNNKSEAAAVVYPYFFS